MSEKTTALPFWTNFPFLATFRLGKAEKHNIYIARVARKERIIPRRLQRRRSFSRSPWPRMGLDRSPIHETLYMPSNITRLNLYCGDGTRQLHHKRESLLRPTTALYTRYISPVIKKRGRWRLIWQWKLALDGKLFNLSRIDYSSFPCHNIYLRIITMTVRP